eukprot:9348325-Pyramimonas_sp.AAC.1
MQLKFEQRGLPLYIDRGGGVQLEARVQNVGDDLEGLPSRHGVRDQVRRPWHEIGREGSL